MKIPRLPTFALLASSALATGTFAAAPAEPTDGPWGLCDMHAPPKSRTKSAVSPKELPTHLSADHGFAVKDRLAVFSGDVLVRRGPEQLQADTVIYDQEKDTAQAQGNVRYRDENLSVDGDASHVELGAETGQFDNAKYRLEEQHARGEAVTAIRESRDVLRLKQSTYTTCNPGSEAWLLRSSTIKLDQAKGAGEMYNATVRFMGVPFLYLPYISFPIDNQRKSGFLIPRIGNTSVSGMDIRIPYYLNLAPNRDATIAARYMSRRGLMMDGEFRYLNRASRGQVDAEYLPGDAVYGSDRAMFAYKHAGSLPSGWGTDLNLNYVSDKDYFRNFGTSLGVASTPFVERRFDVTYQRENLSFLGRMQGLQPVDRTLPSALRPYRRLPQLLLTAAWPAGSGALNYRLQSELVRFDQEDKLTGARLDMQPEVSLPWERAAGYVTPRLMLRHTRYALDNTAPGAPENPARTLPIATLDSGLFFERDLDIGRSPLLQTLEPRLFYLYAPYRDQSALPVFDSAVMDFNTTQLFRDNRYSGVDRVGDANQFSAALTSRLLNRDNGEELIRASIGQIYYMQDRRVAFPGGAVETRPTSNIIGETTVNLTPGWTASADLHWNPHVEETARGSVRLQYQPRRNHILNLAYRYRRDQLEQMDISFFWPLHRNWNAIGRWYYSMPDNRVLESLAGLEYNSCCWAFTILTRSYTTGAATTTRALMMQLELKGLMSVGQSIRTVLERGILGYQGGR
ncbi:MAG: LPS-assembly protein LptD [Pseudomonadota bacterium]